MPSRRLGKLPMPIFDLICLPTEGLPSTREVQVTLVMEIKNGVGRMGPRWKVRPACYAAWLSQGRAAKVMTEDSGVLAENARGQHSIVI